ncbi:vitamin K epoxide reductase family protein [Streptacidiphilus sp. 4-A2]|nr:vitamin K epoxide reductase family protein [Streptacidiphilus sp. 4-A2]
MLGLVLALAGLAVAAYLTVEHYTSPALLACPENSVINCRKVTTSPESVILGIPVVWLGVGFFVAMAALNLPAAWRSGNRSLRAGRLLLAVAGVGTALYLVYAELFEIDAICLYCTAVHVLSVLLFVLTAFGTAATSRPAALSG